MKVEDPNQGPFNKQKVPTKQQTLPDGDNDVVLRESSLHTLNPSQEPALVVKSRKSKVESSNALVYADGPQNDDARMRNRIEQNFAEMQEMKKHNEQYL